MIRGLKFKPGDRLPYIEEGFYKQFSLSKFHLLHIANHPLSEVEKAEITSDFQFPLEFVESPLSKWKLWGVKREVSVLVRPDNYIMSIEN